MHLCKTSSPPLAFQSNQSLKELFYYDKPTKKKKPKPKSTLIYPRLGAEYWLQNQSPKVFLLTTLPRVLKHRMLCNAQLWITMQKLDAFLKKHSFKM